MGRKIQILSGEAKLAEWTISYDVVGCTSKVVEVSGKESSYLYDADGSRLIKREPGRTTLYLPEGMALVKDDATNQVSGKRNCHGRIQR